MLYPSQQNLKVFIQVLLLLNLLKKNKNLHLIGSLLEFSLFKTRYIKDVTGLSEGLLIQEKITIIIFIKKNKIGLQKLKYLQFRQKLDKVAIKWYYFLLLFKYHEVKEKYKEQYLIFLMSQARQEGFQKVLHLFLFY